MQEMHPTHLVPTVLLVYFDLLDEGDAIGEGQPDFAHRSGLRTGA